MEARVPIKVIIRKGFEKGKKKAVYPNFNLIDPAIRQDIPGSIYIDVKGIGWHYDKVENIGLGNETGACCTLVPQDFAEAAVALFPNDVKILDETEFEDFWDNRSYVVEPEEDIVLTVLQKIYYKKQLGIATPEEANALNPNHPAKGIKKNIKKTWKTYKAKTKLKVKGV